MKTRRTVEFYLSIIFGFLIGLKSAGKADDGARAFSPRASLPVAQPHEPELTTEARRESNPKPQVRSVPGYGQLPFCFEVNRGQTDARVRFLARGPGYTLFLMPAETVLRLKPSHSPSGRRNLNLARHELGDLSTTGFEPAAVLRLKLVGANADAVLSGLETLPGKVNYLKGSESTGWRTNIDTYARVKYQGLYPGIDLVYYGNPQQLEYDFVVAPGADTSRIQLAFEGVDAAEQDELGDLTLTLGRKAVRLHKPRVYQVEDGARHQITAEFVLRQPSPGGSGVSVPIASFRLAAYDRTKPLIIDPVLTYSTYLGGSSIDSANSIAVDSSGSAYITGYSQSTDFPMRNALNSTDTGAFVTKLTPDGTGFAFSTYFGGSGGNQGNGIAVDDAGNAYVVGNTGYSADFPIVNGFQTNSTGHDAFLAELSNDGSRVLYSTKLGGTGFQQGLAVAVSSNGVAWITGTTSSTNFPIRNALQPVFQGGGADNPYNYKGDVFVARFDTTLSGDASLIYSTYLGGSDEDNSKGIAVDAAGNAYVTGYTASTNFPTTPGAFQPSFAGGKSDAFVAKINPTGSALVYSTYLGGSGDDAQGGGGIAVDTAGNAFVTGETGSDDFPTKNAWQPTRRNRWQSNLLGYGFFSKLNGAGTDLLYSTFLPGTGSSGIAVDQADSAYIIGGADQNFVTLNGVQTNYAGGGLDGTLVKFDPDGQVIYSTYLGGAGSDGCTGVAVDQWGSAYVTGWTTSTNFPTQNAIQPSYGGGQDGFVAKISDVDTNPPVILGVSNYGDPAVVTVDFSEALDLNSATNPTHYTLDRGVVVNSVEMGINSRTVRILTSGLTNGTTYTLTVNGVLDRAPVPNLILPGAQVSFTALGLYRGFLRQERYDGIDTGGLADLTNNAKFPDHPDATGVVHEFEILPYAWIGGIRLSGYLLPPLTGDYTFYISSRDQSGLFLSRNESPLNALPIAFQFNGGGSRQWASHYDGGFPTNAQPTVSIPVHLEAGKAYYVEAMTDSDAPGVLSVAWQAPGEPSLRDKDLPISGDHLAVLADPHTATLAILDQPSDATIAEGQTAAFSVKATASPSDIFYQWRKSGVEIPGANGPSFIGPEATLAESGASYDCVLTIPGATVTSRAALLTVTNDVTPPTLVSAEGNVTLTNITLTFSEPVNVGDATNTANYSLSGGLSVSSAVLLADRRTVILTTSPQTAGTSYTVQVSGIRDRSAAGNQIAAGTQASVIGWVDEEFVEPFASWANVKRDYGAVGDGVTDDTTALQQGLNEVATQGHAAVLYFPAGTYRITQTLNYNSRIYASLIGEDPLFTVIKWDGPTNTDMMFANGVASSRWSRFTWDGSGKAPNGIHHGNAGGAFQVTGNLHTDEVFKDFGVSALYADPGNGGDSHTIIRCHFLRCFNGIALGSYNAIDWHVWDSTFEDCSYGMHSYVGNFHVYRSLFLRSTAADIHCSDGGAYYGVRWNTSIGSKTFVEGWGPTTIQGNTVIDALDPSPIRCGGPLILLDNTFISRADATNGPVVDVADNLLSAGNTFTVAEPIAVAGRAIVMDDRIVNRDSLGLPPPMIPGFLPKVSRPVLEVAAGGDASAIQQAIDMAVGMNGSRPVVHLPTGQFRVDRTLVIPPGCDLQLVGDGYGDGFWSRGTQLQWTGPTAGPVLRVDGPSHATLREFSVNGGGPYGGGLGAMPFRNSHHG